MPGVLPAVVAAAPRRASAGVVTPPDNIAEAALVPGVRVAAPASLAALVDWLAGRDDGHGDRRCRGGGARQRPPLPAGSPERPNQDSGQLPGMAGLVVSPAAAGEPHRDLADVAGQPVARRAAEICAAGGHHLMLTGPPGVGKTLLAERLPTIMPPLRPRRRAGGQRDPLGGGSADPGAAAADGAAVLRARTTPRPRPRSSAAAAASSSPGAASLAHLGCLFLDEAPEFDRDVLDALRQPLESGEVVIARSGLTARFPARFTLVLAANPCPCARTAATGADCTCSPLVRRRYLARLSGPLLDRVDVKVELLPVTRAELLCDRQLAESSAVVAQPGAGRARTGGGAAARHPLAAQRRDTWRRAAPLFRPAPGALAPLERAMDLGQVSARGADRIIRLSWTLADLAGADRPRLAEVGYALGLWLGAGQ